MNDNYDILRSIENTRDKSTVIKHVSFIIV